MTKIYPTSVSTDDLMHQKRWSGLLINFSCEDSIEFWYSQNMQISFLTNFLAMLGNLEQGGLIYFYIFWEGRPSDLIFQIWAKSVKFKGSIFKSIPGIWAHMGGGGSIQYTGVEIAWLIACSLAFIIWALKVFQNSCTDLMEQIELHNSIPFQDCSYIREITPIYTYSMFVT